MRLLALLALVASAAGDSPPYGFRGMEIYKIDGQAALLHAADADGDGVRDLILANNAKARIEILLRSRQPVPPESVVGDPQPNVIGGDRFYRREEILTEKEVTALVPGDFDGDGHVDVAYYGKPAELVVAYGEGDGSFERTRTFPIDDGVERGSALAAGDLNGDGRTDLVLLAKTYTAVLYQDAQGVLAQPVKLPNTAAETLGVVVADLDGDGRDDLVHAVPADERSVRARLQRADGRLGPEISFRTAPWRGLLVEDVDPRKGAEVLVLQRSSGILRALALAQEPAGRGGVPLGSVQSHAFPDAASRVERDLAIGDLDGDGRLDVVVTEPGTAQVAVHLQGEDGALASRRVYPSLANAEAVRVADLDGDGRAEVVVMSSSEKAVGVSSLREDGALPFPEMLSIEGTPRAMDAADLDGDGRADLALVLERDKKQFAHLRRRAEQEEFELDGWKNAPDGLLVADLDRDGRKDLLLFDRYGPLRVWTATDAGWSEASRNPDFRGGLLQKLGRGQVNVADLDGDGKPELLAASQNFARALAIDAQGRLEVLDQANARAPSSKVLGVAALDVDGDGAREVALYDGEGDLLTVLRRGEGGVFEVAANFPLGRFEFRRLYAADLDGDGREDVLALGKDRFGVFYAGGDEFALEELHTFESPIRDAWLANFEAGDLNGDGGVDFALLEQRNHMVEIASYGAEEGFRHRTQWRVFEEKAHDNRRQGGGEPREIVVDDLDGDGLDDVAVLVHDRLLVYPQAPVPQ